MSNHAKLQLLNQISEVDILKYYLPDFQPGVNQNYSSPFSKKDDNPSLSFYEKSGNIMFKSHNTGHQGDVFQFVADLKGIDCKADFTRLISNIKSDLGINSTEDKTDLKESIKISFDKVETELKSYFATFGVNAEILARYNVHQIKYHEFKTSKGRLCKFDYKRLNQVAICYTVNNRIKVYFPKIEAVQKKSFGYKDQTNEDIFGLAQITAKTERIFIAAGEKDCLVLNANGFPAISFQSENTIPTQQQIGEITALAKEIFIVYDTDEPGQKAAKNLSDRTGWKVISLPTDKKDAAEYFQKYTVLDLNGLITPTAPKLNTIFHQTEAYLSEQYDIRFNTIKLELELRPKGRGPYSTLNENDLYVELNKAGVKIGAEKLIAILKSNYVQKYNPLISYFESLPKHDGQPHIEKLAGYLQTDQPKQLEVQFKKWLVRCVRCAVDTSFYNKQAFILVHSKQNSGKTSFCRFLCPPALSDYIAENITDDKDSRIALAKNFLINLDELSSLARHEINSLKALFSKDVINERLPYDRKNSIIHRVSNFVGSTNMAEFLTDETGSVRWLCFEISGIDWKYRQEVDINKVWAQAWHLYQTGFPADMNADDIAENEVRNAKFQQRSTEAETIPQFLKPSNENDPYAHFMTATDVLMYLSIWTPLKLNKVMIGRALPSCGFQRVKDSKSDRYGYWCLKLKN